MGLIVPSLLRHESLNCLLRIFLIHSDIFKAKQNLSLSRVYTKVNIVDGTQGLNTILLCRQGWL